VRISLKVDYDGKPYLLLEADNGITKDTADDVMKLFIRQARKGIVLKQESSFENCDSYASVRLEDIPCKTK